MTIQECYEKMGADYNGILERLGTQAMVERFAVKFLNDASYASLMEALEQKDYENAFRAVHTLKGVAANLSLTHVQETASELTEELRGGKPLVHPELVQNLTDAYQEAISTLKEF